MTDQERIKEARTLGFEMFTEGLLRIYVPFGDFGKPGNRSREFFEAVDLLMEIFTPGFSEKGAEAREDHYAELTCCWATAADAALPGGLVERQRADCHLGQSAVSSLNDFRSEAIFPSFYFMRDLGLLIDQESGALIPLDETPECST